jgi:hypothetical protein
MNPPPQPIDLCLQISSFEDPIRGRLVDSGGRSVEFTGWIELSSALGEISGESEAPVNTNDNQKEAR